MKAATLALAAAATLLLALGTWQVASAAWIHAKAHLAQHLIARAWQQARSGEPARRPWPWADLRPVARLVVPGRGLELYVLDNASMRALAFGPGHVGGTASPGSWGNTVLVAHRDTHFAFLRLLQRGEEIAVEGAHGRDARYRVREITVLGHHEARLIDPADAAQLTLITCFPFDGVRAGTPWRYVVIAERVA